MLLQIKLIFLVISIGCSVASPRQKHDEGFLETEREDLSRVRRNVATGVQSARSPQNAASQFASSNIQSSYFLGQCVMCPPAEQGPRGAPGPQGMPGRDGRDQIIFGPVGGGYNYPPKATPSPTNQTDTNSSTSGVVYTRWGTTLCPNTSELVYSGVMASSNDHAQKGSGINHICVPLRPKFETASPTYGTGGAWVYGVEYESNLFTSRNLYQNEAPCAVCLAANKETVLTIPGTNKCLGSQGWTLEYQGYMMSSHYTHYKSTFVCIDKDAEPIPRTTHNNNEPLLYVANAKCSAGGGGLPCPPYVDGYDILCAVCTL